MIDIKKCAYKVIIDTREKQVNHILNKFVDAMIKQKYNKEAKNMTKAEYDNVVDGLEKIIKKNEIGA